VSLCEGASAHFSLAEIVQKSSQSDSHAGAEGEDYGSRVGGCFLDAAWHDRAAL